MGTGSPGALVLAAFLLAASITLVAPSARASLYHFFDGVTDPPPNYPGGGSAVAVYGGLWGAQSLQASASYNLTRVGIWGQDSGILGEVGTLEIRPDGGGNPDMGVAPWATATATAASTYGWVNFTFATPVPLTTGTTYWVVLRNPSVSAVNGWNWWNTKSNAYINPGSGKQSNNQGSSWGAAPGDWETRTYGYQETNMVLAMVADRTTCLEGTVVHVAVYLNNTGTEVASRAWINVTLAQGLLYVSDNASQVGGVKTPNVTQWTFTTLPRGTHYFFLNITVAEGAAPGRGLVVSGTLDYRNFQDLRRPPSAASVTIVAEVAVKNLYMRFLGGDVLSTTPPTTSAIVSVTITKGGGSHDWTQRPMVAAPTHLRDTIQVYLSVDTGTHNLETLNVSLYVSDGVNPPNLVGSQERGQTFDGIAGTFENIPPFTLTGVNRTIPRSSFLLLRVTDRGSDDIQVGYSSTTTRARVDVSTDTFVNVTSLRVEDQVGRIGLFVSNDTMVIRANTSDPLGATDITGARVTVTDPLGSSVVKNVAMSPEAVDPSPLPLWKTFRYSYGVPYPAAEGTYRVRVMASETNGVARNLTATVNVQNALLTFRKVVDVANPGQGDYLNYTIFFNNSGTGTSPLAWINDTLPAAEVYVTDNATQAGGIRTPGTTNWTFTNVSPGTHYFRIEAQVPSLTPGGTSFQNLASLDYRDPKGGVAPRRWAGATGTVQGPHVTIAVGSSKGGYTRAEVVRFVVYLNNTGVQAATTVDLNLTVTQELDYQSDTASTEGGVVTLSGYLLRVHFTNLSVGSHSFTVQYTVNSSAAGGTPLPAVAWVNYTGPPGSTYSPASATTAPLLIGPHITAVLRAALPTVNPGDGLRYYLWVNNTGPYVDAALRLNLTLVLDNHTAYVPSPGGTFSGPSNTVAWTYTNVPSGFQVVLVVDVTIKAGLAPALLLLASGRADYTDGVGNPSPTVYYSVGTTVTAPHIAPTLNQDLGALASGDRVLERIYYNNSGNGLARNAWVNVTLDPGWTYVGHLSEAGSFVIDRGRLAWHFNNVTSGVHRIDLTLQAGVLLQDGASLGGNTTFAYDDFNGHPIAAGGLPSFSAEALAPNLKLTLLAPTLALIPGQFLNVTLGVNNTGRATARDVWINDTFDADLRFLEESSGLPLVRTQGAGGEAFSWHLTGLAPGQSRTIAVELQVRFGTAAGTIISDYFTVDNTDAQGQGRMSGRSSTLTWPVGAPAAGPDLGSWMLLGIIGVLASALVLVYLSRRSSVEEVFLVSYGGLLMVHFATSMTPDNDRDIMTAMLTAIQDFIREAFVRSKEGELRHMDFGNHTILIQRGVYSYLAVVVRGRAGPGLAKSMKRAISTVEGQFPDAMAHWAGDPSTLAAAKEVLFTTLLHRGRRWKMGEP